MQHKTVLAIDVGRSGLKVVALPGDPGRPPHAAADHRRSFLLPSAVCQASTLTDDAAARQARLETVSVGGRSFWFGNTALWQGRDDMASGLNDSWFLSDEHFALLLGALEVAKQQGIPGLTEAFVLIGLPGRLYIREKARYQAEVSKLMPAGVTALVIPQPIGPFYSYFYDQDGIERTDRDANALYTVIEIGQHTTDFALVSERRGREQAYTSCAGMSTVATDVQRMLQDMGFSLSLPTVNETLATGSFRYTGSTHDASKVISEASNALARTILNHANRYLGDDVLRSDAILLAGGGAPTIATHLREAWPHLVCLDNPRFCVAEGFSKLGKLLLKADA